MLLNINVKHANIEAQEPPFTGPPDSDMPDTPDNDVDLEMEFELPRPRLNKRRFKPKVPKSRPKKKTKLLVLRNIHQG